MKESRISMWSTLNLLSSVNEKKKQFAELASFICLSLSLLLTPPSLPNTPRFSCIFCNVRLVSFRFLCIAFQSYTICCLLCAVVRLCSFSLLFLLFFISSCVLCGKDSVCFSTRCVPSWCFASIAALSSSSPRAARKKFLYWIIEYICSVVLLVANVFVR